MRQKINIFKILAFVQALGFGIHAQPLAMAQMMAAPVLVAPGSGLATGTAGAATPAGTPAATAPALFSSAPVLAGASAASGPGTDGPSAPGADPAAPQSAPAAAHRWPRISLH